MTDSPKTLQLSPDLALPLDAVTQTFAFLARRGAGKTYTASKLCEEMLSAGAQVVVLDPVGNWYGLRLSPNGRGKGFDIPVFGGEHGDLALEPGAGALVADVIVDGGHSVVLDVSHFRKEKRKQFATDFAEQLFHRKKQARSPLHLFIEEAQVFVPQRAMKGEERMLGAFEDLVKLGRNYGLGVSLISQRPQSVNKDALNQTEALFVLQTGGAQERKSLADWIVYQGVESKSVLDEVPSLPRGTAYVWSPQWLRILKKVKIGKKRTFDASATPEVGAEMVAPRELAPLDLEAIRTAMKTVVDQAKANDPRELKRQIAELQKALAARPAATPAAKPERVVERVEVPIFRDGDVERLQAVLGESKVLSTGLKDLLDHLARQSTRFGEIAAAMSADILKATKKPPARPADLTPRDRLQTLALRPPARRRPAPQRPALTPPVMWGAVEFTRPRKAILDALAWLASAGVDRPTKTQVALVSGASPSSSGYTNNLGALRGAGLITYPAPSLAQLTDAGRDLAEAPEAALSSEDVQREILRRLPARQSAMLRALISAYPDALSNAQLAEASGQSETSSGYTNNRGALRTLGLVDYPASGQVVALPVLFLED